jgi:hypothetical protein
LPLVTLDPPNRTVGDFTVIPAPVARDIKQAVPVSGSFAGAAEVSVYARYVLAGITLTGDKMIALTFFSWHAGKPSLWGM